MRNIWLPHGCPSPTPENHHLRHLPPYLTQNTDHWLTLLTLTLHPDTNSVLNNLILTAYTNHNPKH